MSFDYKNLLDEHNNIIVEKVADLYEKGTSDAIDFLESDIYKQTAKKNEELANRLGY